MTGQPHTTASSPPEPRRTPVYLDHNATTPVDQHVIEAALPFWTEHFG